MSKEVKGQTTPSERERAETDKGKSCSDRMRFVAALEEIEDACYSFDSFDSQEMANRILKLCKKWRRKLA